MYELNPHNSLMEVLSLFLVYRWGNWALERSNNVSKIIGREWEWSAPTQSDRRMRAVEYEEPVSLMFTSSWTLAVVFQGEWHKEVTLDLSQGSQVNSAWLGLLSSTSKTFGFLPLRSAFLLGKAPPCNVMWDLSLRSQERSIWACPKALPEVCSVFSLWLSFEACIQWWFSVDVS